MPNRLPNSPSSVTKPTQIDPQVDPKSSQNRSREGSGATGWPQVRPKSARKPPKSAPEAPREGPGSAPRLPKGAQERQESTEELARSASGALQERARAPQERPEEAQESPKSGPGLPKVSPRGVRVPFQERKRAFSEIAFSCTWEHDFRAGSDQNRLSRASRASVE